MFQININIRFGDEMPVQRPTRIRTNAEEIAEALTAEDTVERAGTHRVRASVSSSEKGQEVSFTPTPNTQRIRAEADSPSTPAAGRNEPCPCGSGKKYKKCCGRA